MATLNYKFILWRSTTLLSIAIVTLAVLAALSGIIIGFNYQPTALGAHESLVRIASDLANGGLILGIHNWAGNAIIIAGLVQIMLMFFGREARKSWFVAWVSGFGLTAMSIALGWTAMILSWNQLGFWRLKIELSTLGSLPVVGNLINTILLDNGSIDTVAVSHFYAIHSYILPVIAIAFAAVHLVSLYQHEQQEKQAIIQQLDRLAEVTETVETEADDLVGSASS